MKRETEDENNEKETTGNGNNKVPELQRDKMESPSDMNKNITTEVVIESPAINERKHVESSTQF